LVGFHLFEKFVNIEIFKILGVKPGEEVEWSIVKGMVVVDVKRKMERPVKFLTSQIKLNLDAAKLVRESRDEFR